MKCLLSRETFYPGPSVTKRARPRAARACRARTPHSRAGCSARVVISELTAVAEEGCAAASSSPSAREAEGVVSAAAPGSSAKTRGRRALLGGSSGAREPREEGREKGREGREESEERKTPRAAESGGAPRTRAGPLGSPGADPPASRPPLLDAAPTASARLAPENAPRTAWGKIVVIGISMSMSMCMSMSISNITIIIIPIIFIIIIIIVTIIIIIIIIISSLQLFRLPND
ncbi:hypothetical protein T492DRAFT_217795 [Pavlovales sp. CCMP2436]|nr:hypothetical protein T492DRAFT_217795 [Pavlovales sp. CCMP2436]